MRVVNLCGDGEEEEEGGHQEALGVLRLPVQHKEVKEMRCA